MMISVAAFTLSSVKWSWVEITGCWLVKCGPRTRGFSTDSIKLSYYDNVVYRQYNNTCCAHYTTYSGMTCCFFVFAKMADSVVPLHRRSCWIHSLTHVDFTDSRQDSAGVIPRRVAGPYQRTNYTQRRPLPLARPSASAALLYSCESASPWLLLLCALAAKQLIRGCCWSVIAVSQARN